MNTRLFHKGLVVGKSYTIEINFSKNHKVAKGGCMPIGLFIQQTNPADVNALCKAPAKGISHHK